MINFILSYKIILLIAFMLALSSFFISNTHLSALFLLLENLCVFMYYYLSDLLNENSTIIILLSIMSCIFVYIISYYFTKSTTRKWQKNNKLHIIIGTIILAIIYLNKDLFSFLNIDIETKKNTILIDDFFILYLIYFLIIIIVCCITILNNKTVKRK